LQLIAACLLAGCASARPSARDRPWPPDAVYPPGDVPRRPASAALAPTPAAPVPAPGDPGVSRASGFAIGEEPGFPEDDAAIRPPAPPAPMRSEAPDGKVPVDEPAKPPDSRPAGAPSARRTDGEKLAARPRRPSPGGMAADGDEEDDEQDTDLTRPRAQKRGEGGGPTKAGEREEDKEKEEEEDEELGFVPPNLLNNLMGLNDSRFKIHGWAEGSFTANPALRANGQNFGFDPNNLANSANLQQLYIIAERRVKQGDAPDLGFRVDNLIGNDWQNFHDLGLFDNVFTSDRIGYDPVQFYAELHLPILNGIDIKGGRFYALAGYEDAQAPSRPLLSTSDMFAFGSHPFTHFGMMTTWHVTDRINVYNGAVNGWNRWINQHYLWQYAGGVSWDSKDERTNLTITLNAGPNQFPHFLKANYPFDQAGTSPLGFQAGRVNLGYGKSDTTLLTTVLIHEWTDDLTMILETDEALVTNVPGIGPGGATQNASYYGLAGWLLYDFAERWTAVSRAEVFRDNNGVLIRDADTFYETTLGAIYKPKPWFWLRPEVRGDWAARSHPYNNGRDRSQLTFGFDVIFLF